ncbi:hypothetical protein BH10BAC5_BH10BAC5_28670 [soil metagenome]
MKREKNRKTILAAVLVILIAALFASATIYAQTERPDLLKSSLMFNVPSDWKVSTVNGMTSYTSPDYSYTLVVTPYTTTSASTDYTSQSNLEYFLNNYKWTSDKTYNPYTFDTWKGYNTVAHTSIDGKDFTGYVYYMYDPSTPGKGYYYYMYTPTSSWEKSQVEIQNIVNSVKYTQPVIPDNSSIIFDLPLGWTASTIDEITTYTSPDNSYTIAVSPYLETSPSNDYTSQTNLDSFLKNYKWTADKSENAENAYSPYTFSDWKGYSTSAHSNINGNDVSGYVYYGYDPKNPGRGYCYYIYTPSSKWNTNQAEMQRLMNSARYYPVTPNMNTK